MKVHFVRTVQEAADVVVDVASETDGSGDSRGRVFVGDVADCGCTWRRCPDWGDVLDQCEKHEVSSGWREWAGKGAAK